MKRLVCISSLLLAGTALVFAQATATINGRVVDPADAVVPNATVTVTNLGTGAARDSATNSEGLYSFPALTPGNYGVKVEAQGFDTIQRNNVELLTAATLSIDFKLQVGSVQQTVEVGATAALVETTQSVGSESIRQEEVSALPMLNRSMAALMSLIPGSREVGGATNGQGGGNNYISVGGGNGHNFSMMVDGIDNKEHDNGGVAVEFSFEGLQEFKTMTNGANAEFGRGAAAMLATTKSGTNQLHGTAFGYFRNDSLVKIDYFSDPAHGGSGKPPFSRQQYGGSVGGPLIKDKLFFFGSVERIQQSFSLPHSTAINQQLSDLIPLNIFVKVTPFVPQPNANLLSEGKLTYIFNDRHSAFLRYAGEDGHIENQIAGNVSQLSFSPYVSNTVTHYYTGVVGDTFLLSPTTVNQFTAQWLQFFFDTHYPPCPLNIPSLGVDSCLGADLTFPSVSTATITAFTFYTICEKTWQVKDDLSKQMGRHALKFGVDYAYVPEFGCSLGGVVTPGSIAFFADPATIVGNLNGQYPQGFQTPGAIRTITETSSVTGDLKTPASHNEISGYAQDDFKLTPKLTLNLGLRWDYYNLLWDGAADRARNPTRVILAAIGSPYGALIPNLPSKKDFQPRLGLAYDIGGNGKDVVRMSYGVFYLEQLKNLTYLQDEQDRPILFLKESLSNTAVGAGALANFVYGVTPLPPILVAPTAFPAGQSIQGSWYDPNNTKDTQVQQFHAGWSHIFASSKDVLSADFTYMLTHHGWQNIDINPLINGVRPLSALTKAVYGDPNLLGPVILGSATMRATYNETAVHYEHRFSAQSSFQVNYVLSWSDGVDGIGDGAAPGVNNPQVPFQWNSPVEFGPTAVDERNRITATGLFLLPFKLELSPSVTWASARPYTLYRAPNPDGDGSLMLLNPSGNPIGIDTQRGSALFVVNSRVTRNFPFGKDGRFSVRAFAELYNITDRANFGNVYGGNQFAPTTYLKPTGYLGGSGSVSTIPNSFEVQFGGRFSF